MDEERWLARLLDACHSELENAQKAEFPPPAGYLEDLRRVTEELERQLAEKRRLARCRS